MTEESHNRATPSRDVFVSYASQDAAIADAVVENLERQGTKCWIAPRDVTPGSPYADEIVGAINDAKILVLVLSQHAIDSAHVGKEIERASSKRRRIIGLRTDAAPLTRSFEYFLSESQWIDVAVLGMPGALTRLTQAVGQGLSPSSWVSPGLGTDAGNPADRKRKPSYLTIHRVIAAAVFLVVAAIVVAVVVRYWPSRQGGAPAPVVAAISEKSIAVLPFADMSQKKDQEYFGDGMAEEILDLLAKIPGLTVIGRTSSFQFKGKNEDLRKIGTELNAAYVLEGSVRNSDDQVRITAQLINTRTGAHEWSETYDRPIGDVLKLQDAIAAAVVRELQLTVDPGYLPSRSTLKSTDTYDLILRGRHAADRWDKAGLDEAVALFRQALDRDPSSADASAELAFAHYRLGADSFLAAAAAFEPARREATTALQLDPKNVLAHLVLSRISMAYDWDWTAAEHELQEVTRLAPGRADGLNVEAHLSLIMGRWDDALRLIQAALARDPMDANSFQYLGLIQARRGHLPEAEAAIRRALDIRPTYAYGHYYLGLFLLERGNREAPLLEMEQETTDGGKQAGLAIVYYALGRREESDAALTRLVKERADVDAFNIAAVFAFRGQSDEAMHWLERAYVQKDASLFFLKFEPALKNLDRDPRYKAFLKKMNLPE
ncbi:MAG: TIR domain-containing protein [Steroidobacteraceae bacterium]